MRRLVIAALAAVAVLVVAGSALAAAGNGVSVIYNSTDPNGPPTNAPSYGPEAYGFKTIGGEATFATGTARSLTNATVTLSSWACQQGSWYGKDCVTTPGATFSQPITLKIYDAEDYHAGVSTPIAQSTQTFNVPYRPSASPKCVGFPNKDGIVRDGGWWQSSTKQCKNGLAYDVTFNFSHVKLPETVVYEISYNTSHYGPNPTGVGGPADSLNVAVTNHQPSVGSTDLRVWTDGQDNGFDSADTPMVQFKAGNAS